ncbi:MAG TPA: hypothetical protein VGG97_09135 [Bryobacteraceae bacterium]|jgi:hypothetical protein
MQFILTGFTQDTGFRVFAFEGVAADRTRTAYTIRADLALTRKHGIRIQELPLLCRGLLERSPEGEQKCPMIFTEEEMGLYERTCADARHAAILKKKVARRFTPATGETGNGWRGSRDSKTAPMVTEQLLGTT